MADPATLTWVVDKSSLPRGYASALQESVDTAGYWMNCWKDLLPPSTTLRIIMSVNLTSDTQTLSVTETANTEEIFIGVPLSAFEGADNLWQADLLRGILDGLADVLGRREPNGSVERRHGDIVSDEPTEEDSTAALLEMMEPEEMFLAANLDGSVSPIVGYHELDEYVLEKVENSGVARVVDAEVTTWSIEITQ